MVLTDAINILEDFPQEYIPYLCGIFSSTDNENNDTLRISFNYANDEGYYYFEICLYEDGKTRFLAIDSSDDWDRVPAEVILISYEVIKRWTDYKGA